MLEIVGRSTGSKERKLKFYCSVGIFFPPQHCDQRLNKSLLCKDKNCVEKMNETYSMKCGRNILLLPELGFQIEQRYKSRHAGLILFGFLLSFILCPNWQSENWSGWIIWCFGNEGEKKKRGALKPACCHLFAPAHLDCFKKRPDPAHLTLKQSVVQGQYYYG